MNSYHKISGVLQRGLLLAAFMVCALTTLSAQGLYNLIPDRATVDVSTPPVMLLIDDSDYSDFASPQAEAPSRLYFTVTEPGEQIHLGLSGLYDQFGRLRPTGRYSFEIKSGADEQTVFGPFTVGQATGDTNPNVTNLDEVGTYRDDPGTDPFAYSLPAAGEYYIEFSYISGNLPLDNNRRWHIGYWDFTVTGSDGTALPGRVWSRNWAFRTPPLLDPGNNNNPLPSDSPGGDECIWNREFNGVMYTHTGTDEMPEGYVSEVNFNNSGFKGLAFNISINSRGPGGTNQSIEDARQSVNEPDEEQRNGIPEYRVFLELPDEEVFPSVDPCVTFDFLDVPFLCGDTSSIEFPVQIGGAGQIDLIIDLEGDTPGSQPNEEFDEAGRDVVLTFNFDADTFDVVTDSIFNLAWNGLDGNGNRVPGGTPFNIVVVYSQGVQHFSAFDVEKMTDGFCISTVRPDVSDCSGATANNLLYYDDRELPESTTPILPATDPQPPVDGRAGAECRSGNWRTWNNFTVGAGDDFACDFNGAGAISGLNNAEPSGYGDRSLLNTWWFANSRKVVRQIVLMDVDIVGPNPVCLGSETNLAATVIGGNPPYVFAWSGPNGFSSTDSILMVTTPGEYIVDITDASGCMASDTIEVSFEGQITCEVAGPDTICFGGTALYAAVPNSDSPPFTYVWTGPAGDTISQDSTVTLSAAGEYCVMITDAGGCETECCRTLTVINEDFSCTVEGPALICVGETATYTAVPSNGDGPYTFEWRFNGDPFVISTDASITVNTPGEYCAITTDANGCETECCQTLDFFPDFSCEIESPGTENGTDVTICEGDSTIFTVVFTNGAPPITLQWELNGVAFDGSDSLTVTQPGTYTITATDGNGCMTTCTRTLIVLTRPSVTVTSSGGGSGPDTICVGDELIYTADTGDDVGPFTYEWTNSAGVVVGTDRDLTVSAPSEYCVVVTNADNCPGEPACRTLENFPELTCEIDPEEDAVCTGETTTFTVTITGGEGPFDFQWSGPNGDFDGDVSVTVGEAGLYIVTVTDANGCVTSCTATLTVLDAPTVVVDGPDGPDGGPGPDTICVGETTIFTANTGDDIGPFTYVWTNEAGDTIATTETIEVAEAGEYCVVVTNAAECVSEPACRTLAFFPELSCEVTSDQTTICAGDSTIFTVTVTGGEAPFEYEWSGPGGPFDNAPDIIVSEDGTYSVTVTDANGCSTECSLALTVIPPPVVVIQGDGEICAGDTTVWTAEVTSDNPAPFTFAWTGPDGLTSTEASIMVAAEGEYCVVVTDSLGCMSETCRTLSFISDLSCEVIGEDAICLGESTTYTAIVSGGEEPYTYEWSGPGGFTGTGESVTISEAGTYSVEVTDANGCMTTCSRELTVLDISVTGVADPAEITLTESTTLTATAGGCTNCVYMWFGPDGEVLNGNGPTITVTPQEPLPDDGLYTYTVIVGEGEDMLCPAETTITVTVRSLCDPDAVKLANAFTPNGDGLNDILFVQTREPRDPELTIELIIYNRWGEEVFTTTSFEQGWDGTHRGDPVPPDAYGYWLQVTCPDGFENTEKGNVTILR